MVGILARCARRISRFFAGVDLAGSPGGLMNQEKNQEKDQEVDPRFARYIEGYIARLLSGQSAFELSMFGPRTDDDDTGESQEVD